MKRTIIINSKYKCLQRWIETLPDIFAVEGQEIKRGRNIIKTFTAPTGMVVNVKYYHSPRALNKFVYSFGIRSPKGERAYKFAQILLQNGFETAENIAYIEERRFGILKGSYFISIQIPYNHLMKEWANAIEGTYDDFAKAFAYYTAKLHEAGILHLDYSPGNILWDIINNEYHFALVDINRMYFGKVSVKNGCASFARLWGPDHFFIMIAKEYAHARNLDERLCVELVMKYRKQFWERYHSKHPVNKE